QKGRQDKGTRPGDSSLAVYGRHHGRGVAGARRRAQRQQLVEVAQLVGAQLEVAQVVYQLEVFVEVLALKAGRKAAVVVGREVLELLDFAREEAPTQRRIWHQPDAQFAQRRQHVHLHIAAPEAVL
nr:hypothetical protein [Tanacetum cinerariifolium]